MSSDKAPMRRQFMRRKAVAAELGITRHTLARLIEHDPSFPMFFAISPGIEVIERDDFEAWIRHKRLSKRASVLLAPKLPEGAPE